MARKPPEVKPAKKRKPRAKKSKAPVAKPKPSTRGRRLDHRRKAAEAIEAHSGPVLNLLAEVVHDLSAETEGLSRAEQDLALCAELSHRLDKAIKLSDPIAEALDGLVLFFVAAAAIGIYRAIEHGHKVKAGRVARLQRRLAERGPQMGAAARLRLERRIKRLEG